MRTSIAIFLANDGDYQEALWDTGLRAAERHGLPVCGFWADNSARKQLRQIEACLNEPDDRRPTVMIVSPVREITLISAAHAAANLGVGWVQLQRWSDYVSDLRRKFPGLPIFVVTADHEAIGRIQGRQFKVLLPNGGKLVYVRGPLGTSSAMGRFAGVQEVLKDSRIELFSINSDWTVDGGRRAIQEWMRSVPTRELHRFVVGAQNDAMAMGARAGLEEIAATRAGFSVDAIPFCGCDGSPRYGQRLVTEGRLTSTVIMPAGAGIAIDHVAAMLGGAPPPPPQIVLAPSSFPDLRVLEGLVA